MFKNPIIKTKKLYTSGFYRKRKAHLRATVQTERSFCRSLYVII